MRFLDLAADLAALATASRSIATKHAALRARQLDLQFPSSGSKPQAQKEPAAEGAGEGAVPPQASTAETVPEPKIEGQKPVAATDSETKEPKDRTDPLEEEVVLPTFAKRSPLRLSVPPSVIRERRQANAATQPPPGGPPRPHPLDPRFHKAARPTVADIVDADVFRAAVENKAEVPEEPIKKETAAATVVKEAAAELTEPVVSAPEEEPTPVPQPAAPEPAAPVPAPESAASAATESATPQPAVAQTPEPVPKPAPQPAVPEPATETLAPAPAPLAAPLRPKHELKESKVPASRLSRMWNYGGLAAGMLGGALTESISRSFGGGHSGDSVMLSAANVERLVSRLSRMRGAALKLGQMMSIQDSKALPGPLQEVLQRVQDRADYMPAWQRDRVLAANLGADWRELFGEFDEKPLAAASIGQVHRATLRATGAPVAVKIQFPGVADSINADLDNIGMLLMATSMLPRGLYLDKTIANARTELAWECDYEREAACLQRFGALLAATGEVAGGAGGPNGGAFALPTVHPEASGRQVLTMSFMEGVPVAQAAAHLSQAQRDWIGTQVLRLCLLEITCFGFMQTDPNWTNFLYNARTSRLELLDFGAARAFPPEFVARYVQLLRAAARADVDGVQSASRDLGYLTGHESRAMLDAHTQSVLTLAEPFRADAPALYDFDGQTITDRVRGFIPVMVRERLAPPPEETYSLHRKLSGAFLLCARLGSRVPCRDLFAESVQKMEAEQLPLLNEELRV